MCFSYTTASFFIRAAILSFLFLLENKADPNEKDVEGNPLLRLAIVKNNFEVINLMIKKGADPTVTDADKHPLFRFVILRNNPEVIRLMIEKGNYWLQHLLDIM